MALTFALLHYQSMNSVVFLSRCMGICCCFDKPSPNFVQSHIKVRCVCVYDRGIGLHNLPCSFLLPHPFNENRPSHTQKS
uniref:Putative secreted protein n=1 Tax=Anopheles marajoara TaxID=58244 RepID=A0A2M4CBX6_9DIPT